MDYRRIFQERNYTVEGHVLPLEQFELFSDLKGLQIEEEQKSRLIARAEKLIGKTYSVLSATDYMLYRRNGNRDIYEGQFFARRSDMLYLALAEYIEDKGRFVDSIVNLVWMILEETSWVIPAHNASVRGNKTPPLPYAYREECDWIDLFSGTSAGDLAMVYRLVGKKLDTVTPLINERLLYELNRRIVAPVLDTDRLKKMWWAGYDHPNVNNWNPWIVSNVLLVTALTVSDLKVREAVVRQLMPVLDVFTATYKEDGGCEEGPSYWNAAGATLYDCLCLLYDMTGGYVDLFTDPLVRRMGEYRITAFVHGNRFLNFGDAPAKLSLCCPVMYDWGVRSHSSEMVKFAEHYMQGELPAADLDNFLPYRSVRWMTMGRMPKGTFVAPKYTYLNGQQIAVSREYNDTGRGLYLAFKGGDNGVSHNHNDVGSVIVFSDGKPLFVDAGSGQYTAKTFSSRRYEIWAMQSDHHNTATINGHCQSVGRDAEAKDCRYEEATGALSMELSGAYPAEADVQSYVRRAEIAGAEIVIRDTFSLKNPGRIALHFITAEAPVSKENGVFTLAGRTVTYDKSLAFTCEALENEAPETARIPKNWDTDVLYRITLCADGVKEADYTTVIR